MPKKPKEPEIIEPVGGGFDEVMSVLAPPVGPKKKTSVPKEGATENPKGGTDRKELTKDKVKD